MKNKLKSSNNTYSLQRLKALLIKQVTFDRVWLGGWCVFDDDQLYLTGQADAIPILNAKHLRAFNGRMILLQVQPSSFQTTESGDWVIKDFIQHEVLQGNPDRTGFFNLEVSPQSVLQFSQFLFELRSGLSELGLTEVLTPSLVDCPGSEPTLDPMKVGNKYLPTSPEWHLKKYLAAGYTDIYEIKKCFRGGEHSPVHHHEFLMLEWYRGFADLKHIKNDLIFLLKKLSKGEVQSVQNFTVSQLFAEVLGEALCAESTREDLLNWMIKHKIEYSESDTFDDLFFRIMIEKVEPWLATRGTPVIVEKYPPSQAALAQIDFDGWADRFELYWRGVELANAFFELTDPVEQRARFESDNLKKLELGKPRVSADEGFFTALEKGLPPSGGIALGVERLFLVINKMQSLDQVNLFRGRLS